jgi:beta-barrel assembly-enhancing protease
MRILTLIVMLLALPIHAQSKINFDRYKPLESQDPLPDIFRQTSSERVQAELSNAEPIKDAKTKRAETEFIRVSEFEIDRFLTSGRVAYNDPISKYCNAILDHILSSGYDKGSAIVFLMRAALVNAFATRQGYILVTPGIIARLENEAQLAFVLCHEYIHYKNEHSLQTVREDVNISKKSKSRKKSDGVREVANPDLERSRFSRELETEADLEGLQIYLKSEYSRSAPSELFDLLKVSDLPFDDIKIPKSYLELPGLTLPADRWLEQTAAIDVKAIEEADDTYSTHPNLVDRAIDVNYRIKKAGQNQQDGKPFIISENTFLEIRKIARFEELRMNLLNKDYERALYHSYLLSLDDPGSYFVHWARVKALYGLAMYSANRLLDDVHLGPDSIQGASQSVHHMVAKMSKEEIILLALKHAWHFYKTYPEEKEAKFMVEDLMFVATAGAKITPRSLKSYPFEAPEEEKKDDEEEEPAEEEEEDNKNKRRKRTPRKRATRAEKAPTIYIYHSFIEELKDSEFKSLFRSQSSAASKNKGNTIVIPPVEPEVPKTRRAQIKQMREKKRKERKERKTKPVIPDEKKFNLKSVIVFDPVHYHLQIGRKTGIQYENTERAKERIQATVEDISIHAEIKTHMVSRLQDDNFNAAQLNRIALFGDFMRDAYFNGRRKVAMLSLDYARLADMSQLYGTPYLSKVEVYSLIYKKSWKSIAGDFVSTLFFPPISLYYIYSYIVPRKETYFIYRLMNISARHYPLTYQSDMSTYIKSRRDITRSILYYLMINGKKNE